MRSAEKRLVTFAKRARGNGGCACWIVEQRAQLRSKVVAVAGLR
jgi:hypothetical protein